MATMTVTVAALQAILASVATAVNLWLDTTTGAGGATGTNVKASSTVVFAVRIDNLANAAVSYYKTYNTASPPTVGTTVPDEIVMVPATSIVIMAFQSGSPPVPGKTYATGFGYGCVTVGGTTGTTAPSSSVLSQLAYT